MKDARTTMSQAVSNIAAAFRRLPSVADWARVFTAKPATLPETHSMPTLPPDAEKVHALGDGRWVIIYRTPDKFSPRCKMFVMYSRPGQLSISARLANVFDSLDEAITFCQIVFAITEWNIK